MFTTPLSTISTSRKLSSRSRAQPFHRLETDPQPAVQIGDFFTAAVDDDDRVLREQPLDRGHETSEEGLVLDLVTADLQNQRMLLVRHQISPIFSSQPSMMFIFCTAWPDAPLIRLSIDAVTMSRRAAGTKVRPIAQKFV